MSLTDITAQLAPYIDPQATRKAKEQQATKLLTDRLGVNPNRLGGTLFNQALGNVAKNENLFARAAGLISPEEQVNREMMNQANLRGLNEQQMLQELPSILRQQGQPMRGAMLQMALQQQQAEMNNLNALTAQRAASAASSRRSVVDTQNDAAALRGNQSYLLSRLSDTPEFEYLRSINEKTGEARVFDLPEEEVARIQTRLNEREDRVVDFRPMIYSDAKGNLVGVMVGEDGSFKDFQGNEIADENIPKYVVNAAVTATKLGDLDIGEQQKQDLQEAAVNVGRTIDVASRLHAIIEGNPGAQSLTGQVASFLNEVNAELAYAGAEFANIAREAPERFDMDAITAARDGASSNIQLLGVAKNVADGLVIRLAYINARADQNGNSISDQDIINQIQALGANRADPNALRINLESMVEDNVNRYKMQYKIATGEEDNTYDNWRDLYYTDSQKEAEAGVARRNSIGLPNPNGDL